MAWPAFSDKANMTLMNLTENLSNFLNLLPAVRHSSEGRLLAFYEEGDVLYVHFGPQPRPATDSDVTDDDTIVRYQRYEVIKIPILHAIPW